MTQSKTLLVTDRFRVDEVTRTSPDGRTRSRAIVRHPGAVAIIPMVDDHHVCLIANYRVSVAQTLLEIPAGTLDPGESPLETARRELTEETGYTADNIEPLAEFYLSPGVLDEKMHLFVARGLTPGAAAREAGEEIENRVTPWPDAIQLVLRGQIRDAKTIAGLLILEGRRSTPRGTK